ncbi:MAG: DUF3592 domain-containing protein [Verrucomicrobiales bacterium]|nr:DUF3592 domain-containing protein [Verrucomicrobiales bacterium]
MSSSRPPLNLAGRLWKIAMGLVLVTVGSLFVYYLWGSYERAAKMDLWVETPCLITSMSVDDSELNQRGMPKYIMEVRYAYEFGGKEFTGDRIKRLPIEASDPRKLKKHIERYQKNTQLVCFVDPAEPSSAVLKKDTKAALYSIWFPGLFILGGGGMILSALFRRSS